MLARDISDVTLIMACAAPEGLVLAADTIVISGVILDECPNKWFRFGPWHIGSAGSCAAGQALEFGTGEPPPSDIAGLVAWMRRAFQIHGVKKSDDDGYGTRMVVANQKNVWDVDLDLYVHPYRQGVWAAVGSGRDFALGALAAFEEVGHGLSPVDIARMVLEIVDRRVTNVRGCRVELVPYGPVPQLHSQGRRTPAHGPIEVPE